MSQRSRNSRGSSNRNDGQGEEHQLWRESQDGGHKITALFNKSSENVRQTKALDSYLAANPGAADFDAKRAELEAIIRGGVKINGELQEILSGNLKNVEILSAIARANQGPDDAQGSSGGRSSSQHLTVGSGSRSGGGGLLSGSSRNTSRSARDKEKASAKDAKESAASQRDANSLYDFDGGESPVPSPLGPARKLGSDRSGNRDSLPPRGGDRDTPSKAGSAEPPAVSGSSSAAAIQRSKVSFIKGQDVVFKFKPQQAASSSGSADATEWFLGKVQAVIGEGKARRYKVKDEDPDLPPEERKEYRISASSMIPLPPAGQDLPELEKGKTVLAMYPDSTTFYKAEVMSTDAATSKVNLRFEGEETTGTLQLVERRYVVEYRA